MVWGSAALDVVIEGCSEGLQPDLSCLTLDPHRIGKMRYCCDDTIDAHANDCYYECTIELQRQITVMI
jgi:hypothetical protein